MLHIWWRGFKDQTVGRTFGIPHRVPSDVVDRLSSKVLSTYRPKDVNIIAVNLLPPYDFFFFICFSRLHFDLMWNGQRKRPRSLVALLKMWHSMWNVQTTGRLHGWMTFVLPLLFFILCEAVPDKKIVLLCAFLFTHKKLVFQYEKISQLNQTKFYLLSINSQQRLSQDN